MSARDDITVDTTVAPRVITVAAPSTVLTVQDLLDTLREWEQEMQNLEQKKIVDAAGKDDLGGGLQVEITITLLDAVITFEARGGPGYTQCLIDGGNIVALDADDDPIESIFDTPFTQILRTNASSSVVV